MFWGEDERHTQTDREGEKEGGEREVYFEIGNKIKTA